MAFSLNDIIKWVGSAATMNRPALLWRTQGNPVIDRSTKSFKKGTLYQLRAEGYPESYSLIYCNKDFTGTINWNKFKAVGDKGLHAYTDYNEALGKSLSNTLSSVFYVVTKYVEGGELPGPEDVESASSFVVKVIWATEAEIYNSHLNSGEVGFCEETRKFYTFFNGIFKEVGNLYPGIEVQAQVMLIKKVYDSYEDLMAAANNIEVGLYEMASISADSLDDHEGEIYCKVLSTGREDGETEWQYVGQFNTKDYYDTTKALVQEAANLLVEIEDLRNEAEEAAKEYKVELTEHVEAKTVEFDNHVEEKTTGFDSHVVEKKEAFNANADAKTQTFNANAADKAEAFDVNASGRTIDFNLNATGKTSDFNTNATQKTVSFNENVSNRTEAFNDNVEAKEGYLHTYVEDTLKPSMDSHADALKSDMSDHKASLESEMDSYERDLKTRLDNHVTGIEESFSQLAETTVREALLGEAPTEAEIARAIEEAWNG